MHSYKKPFKSNSYIVENILLSLSAVPSFSLALMSRKKSRKERRAGRIVWVAR